MRVVAASRAVRRLATRASSAVSATAPRFAGCSVLVTGGAAGIGKAIAASFGGEGSRVVVFDREVAAGGDDSIEHRCVDIADREAVAAAVAAAFPAGTLDVLVNNAAAFVFGDVASVSVAAWRHVLDVNVMGTANVCAAALPLLERGAGTKRRRGGSAIVMLSSISAFIAQPAFVPYAATKAALLQMTRNMAMDGAAKGIRVNAVCPGPILTAATAKHAASLGKSVVRANDGSRIAPPPANKLIRTLSLVAGGPGRRDGWPPHHQAHGHARGGG